MYQIIGKYHSYPPEVIDQAETLDDARMLRREYQIAYGCDWVIEIKRLRTKSFEDFQFGLGKEKE
jgi:hypothetical protein